jgi:hypothetical protein
MKRMTKSEMNEKFRKEAIERTKLNYLVGGDGNGGQGATDDPWS